jgi:hypothetical protein
MSTSLETTMAVRGASSSRSAHSQGGASRKWPPRRSDRSMDMSVAPVLDDEESAAVAKSVVADHGA